MEDIEKVATVNTAHPIVSNFTDFCEAITKIAQTRALAEEFAEGVEQMNTFIKQAGKAKAVKSTVGKGVDLLRHGVKGVSDASKAGQRLAEEIIPGRAGQAVGMGVRAAPVVGGLGLAEAGYEHARYGPTLAPVRRFPRAAYEAVAGRVPLESDARLRRHYRTARGQ